jgi:hypothetical protein
MGSAHCLILYLLHLKPFSLLLDTINQKKLKAKYDNRGIIGIYLGRAVDHSPYCVRVFNPETQKVLLSKDVKFMNKFYNDYFATTSNNPFSSLQEDDNDDDDDIFYDASPTYHIANSPTNVDDDVPDLIDENSINQADDLQDETNLINLADDNSSFITARNLNDTQFHNHNNTSHT